MLSDDEGISFDDEKMHGVNKRGNDRIGEQGRWGAQCFRLEDPCFVALSSGGKECRFKLDGFRCMSVYCRKTTMHAPLAYAPSALA
jgi:hypothetical protein